MRSRWPTGSLASSSAGALVLAPVVDDAELSEEIMESVQALMVRTGLST